ncbi:hypothetical protein HPB50_024519 [Hyalomma asiaticum]|uniref:Uncharacterized protein n=1 Tax=Hyalomma asiaticum TaxID=266040 RepID=A0ACB7TLL2_HYAAI|nr:hypothetical protein HPB50_024519 [Hyalomma asiaticum]
MPSAKNASVDLGYQQHRVNRRRPALRHAPAMPAASDTSRATRVDTLFVTEAEKVAIEHRAEEQRQKLSSLSATRRKQSLIGDSPEAAGCGTEFTLLSLPLLNQLLREKYLMPRCFVTGCKSGYDSARRAAEKRHFCRLPNDASRLQEWQHAIPRSDRKLTSSCVVCDLHFMEEDIMKNFMRNICGDVVVIPRDKWSLKDAIMEAKMMEITTDSADSSEQGPSDHVYYRGEVEDSVVYYLSGYNTHKFTKHVTCHLYIEDISSATPVLDSDSYLTDYRSFKQGSLKHPTWKMLTFMKIVNKIVSACLDKEGLCGDIFWKVLEELKEHRFSRLGCGQHNAAFTCQVLNFFVITSMHFYSRDVNHHLGSSEKVAIANRKACLL